MKVITSQQFFDLTAQAKGSFKASVSRGEAALAFGTAKELAGGQFLDLDVVTCLLSDELTPAFGRKFSATLLRWFCDVWLAAVHRAEREQSEPIWLVVIETGKVLKRARSIEVLGKSTEAPRLVYDGVNIGFGTLPEAGKSFREGIVVPERMTFINVTSLVADLHCRADHLGIPLGEFLVPELDDPDLASSMAHIKASREAMRERAAS